LVELQNHYDEIKTYDAVILAVSVKSPETNKYIMDKFGLEYPMLSDEASPQAPSDIDYQVVNQYSVLDGEGDVRPSTFIIDKKGIVTWRHIGESNEDTVDSSVIIEELQNIHQ